MKLSEELLRKLRKQYEPVTLIEAEFKGLDLTFKTDNDGNPIVLFIGHKESNGKISGLRYTRTLINGIDGKAIKDHWDLKGKSS